MGFFSRLTSLFSARGRDDDRLVQALAHAKAGRPERAIEIYDALIASSAKGDVIRARALFNRALAYSAMKNDEQAIKDLREALASPNLPENVQAAARTQLARVQKRNE